MAWTAQNLADVEAAILAIATGALSYSINGRTVTKANLADLKKLRSEMLSELGSDPMYYKGTLAIS